MVFKSVVAAKPFEDDEDLARIVRGRLQARFAEDARYRSESADQAKPQSAGAEPNHVATCDAGAAQ
jgi:hypothetical protein